jgi:hypothetical protein
MTYAVIPPAKSFDVTVWLNPKLRLNGSRSGWQPQRVPLYTAGCSCRRPTSLPLVLRPARALTRNKARTRGRAAMHLTYRVVTT